MGPCNWDILPTCPDWDPAATPDSPAGQAQARAEAVAVWLLWSLTARVFGVCPVVVRPCFRPPDNRTTYRGRDGGAGSVFWPGLINGSWVNGPCGCTGSHRCTVGESMLALPGPVVTVTEVRVDGQVLPADEYRIKDNRWLLRIGADWPQTQDLDADDDEPGAFTVKYTKGVAVPLAGRYAAGDLACELLRGMTGGACALPSRAISVARQGVDVQLLDPAQYLDGGLTGIPSVDAFIKSINPGKARSQPKVYNPDLMGWQSRIRPGA